ERSTFSHGIARRSRAPIVSHSCHTAASVDHPEQHHSTRPWQRCTSYGAVAIDVVEALASSATDSCADCGCGLSPRARQNSRCECLRLVTFESQLPVHKQTKASAHKNGNQRGCDRQASRRKHDDCER